MKITITENDLFKGYSEVWGIFFIGKYYVKYRCAMINCIDYTTLN